MRRFTYSEGKGVNGGVDNVVTDVGIDELRRLLVDEPTVFRGSREQWVNCGDERRTQAKTKLPWIIAGGLVEVRSKSGRTASDIKFRSMVTLDIDDCRGAGLEAGNETGDAVSRLGMLGICGFVYETVTSRVTAGEVKIRVIVPLMEDIDADSYGFVARILAYRMGLLKVDDNSFRPAQIMFLPATFSDDGMFRGWIDGGLWDAIDELSAWPIDKDAPKFLGEDRVVSPVLIPAGSGDGGGRGAGVISAFLECWDAMSALLKFCGDRYEPIGDRLRRVGSKSMGGIVRVDRGVYSHHSTECPLAAAGDDGRVHAYNAFDAVRIVKGWTVPEMVKWAAELPEVRKVMDDALMGMLQDEDGISIDGRVDVADVVEAGGDVASNGDRSGDGDADGGRGGDGDDGGSGWASSLVRKNGRLVATFSNVKLCLTNLSDIRFNELTGVLDVWKDGRKRPWRDSDIVLVRNMLEVKVGMEEISDRNIWQAAMSVGLENVYDPVKDWIEGQPWDGVERLDRWLVDWTRCEDSELNRLAGRLTMLALVARQYEPGHKYDYATVLRSGQGAGKDTLWSRVAGDFYRSMSVETMMHNREAAEQVRGGVIVDMSELGGMTKVESAVVKEYITRTVDRTRHAYDRSVTESPRRFILVGSTNQDDFLVDETGNRRFLVVSSPCDMNDPFPMPSDPYEYQQLWAEALHVYKAARLAWPAGPLPLYLPKSLLMVASSISESHRMESEQDVFDQRVLEWLESAVAFRDEFRVGDILQSLGMRVDRSTVSRVGRSLRKIQGFARVRDEKGSKYVKVI